MFHIQQIFGGFDGFVAFQLSKVNDAHINLTVVRSFPSTLLQSARFARQQTTKYGYMRQYNVFHLPPH